MSVRTPLVVAVVASATLVGCLDSPGDGGDGGDGGGLPAQLLSNPDFEDRVAGWTFDGSVEIDTAASLNLPPSDAGPLVALLGGLDNQMDVMRQAMVVPDAAHTLELSGVRCYTTTEGPMVYDTFTISIESMDTGAIDVLVSDDNLDATGGECTWLSFERKSEDHAGEQIRLVIEGVTDGGGPSSFAIDGLALTASP